MSFTRKTRLPGGRPNKGFGDFAPDLCIEILLPSEEQAEIDRKLAENFAPGEEQVWHLFPETRQVTVYSAPTAARIYRTQDDIDAGDLLPGFRCCVEEHFSLE